MNRRIAAAAILVPAIALTGCSAVSSLTNPARPTSSTVQQAEAAGEQLIAKCVNGNLSTAELITLVTSHGGLKGVAACLHIKNRAQFEAAVRASAIAWGESGGFNTKLGRDAWLIGNTTLITKTKQQVPSLPQIVGMYS